MHWTVNAKGDFEIQDGQNGKTFSSMTEMYDAYGADRSRGVVTYRLDTCAPNWDAMASDSVIRATSKTTGYDDSQTNKVKNKVTGEVYDGDVATKAKAMTYAKTGK